MLESKFKRYFNSIFDSESWEEYCQRLDITTDSPARYFFHHVIFDHYDSFSSRFPWFNVNSFTFTFEYWSAESIHEKIKYDYGEELEFWYQQVDRNDQRLTLLQFMVSNLTWPIPVVIFDFVGLKIDDKFKKRLTEFHLIEGTHRVSYLKRLLCLGKIDPSSAHKILVLRPKR